MIRSVHALVLLFPATLFAQQPAANGPTAPIPNDPSQNVRVEGTVTSAVGDPVRQPTLRLDVIGITTAQLINAYSATGDSAGKFVFASVPPGRYTLTASKAGFISQKYGARSFTGAGATVTIEAGHDVKDLAIKLIPQGVIGGKVTDEDGDPVRGVSVTGFRMSYDRNGRRFVETGGNQTNDLGEFRIQGLAPGRYYLMAEPVGEIPGLAPGHRMTYYPDGLDSGSAVAIEVAAGAEVQGMDIRLRREKSYTIKGKAIDTATGAPAGGAILRWAYKGARSEPQPRIIYRVRDDGSFAIRNLLPATYVIEVLPGGSVSGAITTTLGLSGKLEITVSDSNIDNVVFPLSAGADVSGTFRVEDGDIQPIAQSGMRPSIALTSSDGPYAPPNRMKDDGTFKLDRLSAGSYFLDVAGLPPGTYIKSARYGVRDVTHSTLDLSAGSSTLDILLSAKAAQVSGVVRDSDGQPMRGITVSIWPKTPDRGTSTRGVRTAVSDQNGNFRIGSLPPDDYYAIAFDDIDPNLALFPDFLSRFDGDAASLKLAESGSENADVKIIPSSRIAAEIVKLPSPPGPAISSTREGDSPNKSVRDVPAPVSGRVLDIKGDPVKKATVRISGPDSYLGQTAAITDANGVYAFEDVPPGVYELSAEKSGFLTQKLGSSATNLPGAKLNLKPGEHLQTQDFKLVPQGVIAGRVTNQAGQPQPNTNVSAMSYQYVQGHRRLSALFGGTSDAQGNYRIFNVPPGRYYLSTAAAGAAAILAALGGGANTRSGPDSPLKTFYPSASDVANAAVIEVAPGAELRGMDIQTRTGRTYSIKGKVTAAPGSGPLNEQFLTLRPKDRNNPTLDSATTRPNSADGAFEFQGVLPGTYTIQAGLTRLGNTFAAPTLFSLEEVTVTDANVGGLTLALTPGFRVNGTVSLEGSNAHPRPLVRLIEPADSGSGYSAQSTFKDDGTFEMKDVAPVKYQLQLNLPAGTYIKSARMAGQDALHSTLDLTAVPSTPLDVVLSANVAEVSGIVKKVSGEAAGSALIVLWPKAPLAGVYNGNLRSVGADLKGGFLLNDVAPGEYFALAFEQIEQGLSQSTEFLSRFGGTASEISVDPGAHASIDLRVIPQDRVAAETAKLP
jgi:protocatechuate 3,4-dioxygenase beta subunit